MVWPSRDIFFGGLKNGSYEIGNVVDTGARGKSRCFDLNHETIATDGWVTENRWACLNSNRSHYSESSHAVTRCFLANLRVNRCKQLTCVLAPLFHALSLHLKRKPNRSRGPIWQLMHPPTSEWVKIRTPGPIVSLSGIRRWKHGRSIKIITQSAGYESTRHFWSQSL